MQPLRGISVFSVVVVAVIMAGCGTAAEPPVTTHVDTTAINSVEGSIHTIEPDEPYASVTLATLGDVSDLVIQAKVTAVKHGIVASKGDPSATGRQYTVERTGKQGPDVTYVLVTEALSGRPVTFPDQPNMEPGDEAIWVLDRIAPEFDMPGFVLTATNSIFPIVDGKIAVSSSFPAGQEATGKEPAELLRQLGAE